MTQHLAVVILFRFRVRAIREGSRMNIVILGTGRVRGHRPNIPCVRDATNKGNF